MNYDHFVFGVSRNGAVWHNLPTLTQALGYVAYATTLHEPSLLQGFDETGKSAVVRKPADVRVEVLGYVRGHGYQTLTIDAKWLDGKRVF
jgi:hypothetical protein